MILTYKPNQSLKMPSKVATATGRPIGKAGARAMRKNDDAVRHLLELLSDARTADDIQQIITEQGILIGRVCRPMGGGRIIVNLQTGDIDVSVPIAGAVRMHGKAGNKTDRSYCMCSEDFIVIRGGLAVAKIPLGVMDSIREVFDRCGVVLPHSFSSFREDESEGAFVFDRSGDMLATDTPKATGSASAAAYDDVDLDIDSL